jgi:soluble lytic murein transglycosylase-like protein
MLPGTAQEMAARLGLPYRPDLLQSNDPAALDYQRRLGAAYLEEGYKRTGNIRDALRYYHGGPDPRNWGPKTNAYADSVLARLGS